MLWNRCVNTVEVVVVTGVLVLIYVAAWLS